VQLALTFRCRFASGPAPTTRCSRTAAATRATPRRAKRRAARLL